jgi:hypothetical protein
VAGAVRRTGLTVERAPRRLVVRSYAAALALPGLVGLSTLLHWLAGRRLTGLWILPDEAIYAARALGLWRHGSLPLLHGQGAGYSVLYPIVAGFPLSVGSLETGYGSLKLLQALVVSLAAVPVFAYGRRLMPARYALLAAALTLCSPLLLYSGLLMTEVLFYPLVAWTLLATARAVTSARLPDQAIALALIAAAVLTRTQAVVLLPVFGGAVLLEAVFARSRARLRAFWPVWALIVAAGIVVVAAPGTFGSYAGTLRGSYPLGLAIGLTFEHLALAVIGAGVLPAAALALLAAEALRGRIGDPGIRGLVATAVAALALVCVQVGFFAARFSPHLLERDLAALPPLLFTVFALWLGRGARRPLVVTVATSFAVVALVLLVPWHRLVTSTAFPDSFGLGLLLRLPANPANVVAIAVPLLLVAFVALPRRATPALAALVGALLVGTSAVASNTMTRLDRAQQESVVGTPAGWIDQAADGRVAYFYDGEAYWTTVYQERFWNQRIAQVVATSPVPGPMPQTRAHLGADGRLPIDTPYVVASDQHEFVGDAVAHHAQTGTDITGLTLWKLDGPPQLSLVKYGIQPNGDMVAPAEVYVYDCGGGALQLTLLPKATKRLRIELDGRVVVDEDVAGQEVWHGLVPVPPSRKSRTCVFRILPQGLLGSTVIQFNR